MTATLYVVPASHPCAAVERALELKGIGYKRVDLVPVFHAVHQRLRFGGRTVPGLVLDGGRKLQGSRTIIAALDELQPEPPMYPSDPDARRRADEAEQWGDEVLQPLARRVVWQALSHDTSALLSYSEGARLRPPVPTPVARMSGGMIAWAERRLNAASEPAARADLLALPRHLDRVDAWLADGTLGAGSPTAADLQVASGLRLLTTIEDLEPLFAGRPADEFARRVVPVYPGRTPRGALPADWLAPAPVSAA